MKLSSEYKKNLKDVHKRKKGSFKGLLVKYEPIKNFVEKYKPTSLIDFGCGKGTLLDQFKIDFPYIQILEGYDPGVEEFEKFPTKTYECLTSNDVIEHIEPDYLDTTLKDIENLFTKSAWLIIACYKAKKKLPDGRNAHLIIENPDWWIEKIKTTLPTCKIISSEVVEFAEGKPEIRIILEK